MAGNRLPYGTALGVLYATFLLTGTIVFSLIEGWAWSDSLYFTAITIKTIGLGDIVPHTGMGRVAVSLLVFVSMSITALWTVQVAMWQIQWVSSPAGASVASAVEDVLNSKRKGWCDSNRVVTWLRARSDTTKMLVLFAIHLAGGVGLFMVVERLSFSDSYHLCITLVTTVGYGDVVPTTWFGKLTCIAYAMVATGSATGVATAAGAAVLNAISKPERTKSV